MMPMDAALAVVAEHSSFTLGTETVPLAEALGRVTAEDITAREPLPPFDAAIMDG